MIQRAALTTVLAVLAVAACSRRQQPPAQPEPPPQQTTQTSTQPTTPDTAGEGARRAAAAAAAETARLRGVLSEMVHFDYDESRIRSDAEQVLQQKLPILRANPGVALHIVGHADERGSVEYNLALGLRRANAVRDFLTSFGVDGSRLSTETMGEDRPVDSSMTEAAYARNRRAEFTISRGGETLVSGR